MLPANHHSFPEDSEFRSGFGANAAASHPGDETIGPEDRRFVLKHPEKRVVVATDSIPVIKPAEPRQGFGPLKRGLVGHAREPAGQMVAADLAPRDSPRGGFASILLHHLHTTLVDTVTQIACDPPPGVG